MPRVALLAAADGWHLAALARAFANAGWESVRIDPTRLVGRAGDGARLAGPGGAGTPSLEDYDAVVVRLVPPGSLDQIVFRIDALHLLADRGRAVVNHPRALERTIDKHWTTRLLDGCGVPTPRTIATERDDRALADFETIGDVVVHAILGSAGG